ncbi:MAG: hypothetical protein HY812_15380 [Planctomycetes bacterium]|nr:hypothetical protein [Planctomycetota bacterium]
MSSMPDEPFCGHCGERLPAFGARLGFCPACAERFRRTIGGRAEAARPARFIAEFTNSGEFAKDPLLAAVLSVVFPGGGQVYNGHLLKALLIFVTSPLVIPWLIGIADAFFSARRHNAGMHMSGAQPA